MSNSDLVEEDRKPLSFDKALLSQRIEPTVGALFIISAPAGAGKTTLVTALISHFPTLELALSYTTRMPRAGEMDGVHYHFISKEAFCEKRAAGDFIESVELHGNLYGSCRHTIQKRRGAGAHLIMVIDTEGAKHVVQEIEDAVSIFITVPTLEVLKQRLIERNSETKETLEKRLNLASKELLCSRMYDYTIMNDQFGLALETLACIVVAEVHKKNQKQA
ncbi:MAG: guanylate kinase [Chlamydia sp.]